MTEKDFVYVACCRELDEIRSILEKKLHAYYENSKNVGKRFNVCELLSEFYESYLYLSAKIGEIFK